MFKNAILYHINCSNPLPDRAAMDDALGGVVFAPTAPTQQASAGFVPPRGHEHAALHERIAGELILKVRTETRAVPAAELQRQVDAKAKVIEDQTGRKPGKKQRRELKEEVLLELLPRAFPKRADALVWISPNKNLVVVDASSAARASDVAALLVQSQALGEGCSLHLLQTNLSPAAAMAAWLAAGEVDGGNFTLGREAELKAADETKATVKYAHHGLDLDEIRGHLRQGGKLPTKLALDWRGRVGFVLTDTLAIKRIAMDDGVIGSAGEQADAFDADVAIFTGEMGPLLFDLEAALDLRIYPET